MNESQLLAELQSLTLGKPKNRGGLFTTCEVALELSEKIGITHEAAKRRVLKMWHAARREGRLISGRVQIDALDRRMDVQAYRLKSKG